ncbi:RNA-binding protein [Candidatus Binatia bacterium]|nr:RNA-binding protein [Candidatus Binatia bacterium]
MGNLNFATTESALHALFAEVGEVAEVFLPADRETGRPRGFAFVEFADSASAARAVERFSGYELDGRTLRVTEAEERRPRLGGGGGGGGGGWAPGPDPGPPMGFGGRDRPKPKGSRRGLRARKRSL